MHREVNAIAGRLSLRPPQRQALEILDRITEIVPLREQVDPDLALEVIKSEFPTVTDFEREFPSLCFSLATGVGKTRLMGAFITYLHRAHGIDNFFVLAPNLTIYNKLISDFTPGSPKYVFKGVAEFATDPPEIITGDNYESRAGTLFDQLIRCKINIFNISKINTEVRGGKSPRIKRLSEYLGESYFEYLAAMPDLVLLMDESHRYRASAGIRAINELKPILGLELTATPYTSSGQNTVYFRNVIMDYPLRKAMDDGFVKDPAAVTRENLNTGGMTPQALERMKLEDGIRLHEQTRVELETYAREHDTEIVKPFMLVIARDTTHAGELLELIRSDSFFDGRYRDKVIQVDSSGTGAEKDEVIERLLQVERRDEPTEIVIHVNMLKEGWDVTNLYTIVPLRAANARVLIEQTIGRGLRLPYGKRTGVDAVDTLSIIAHDKFQEIIDEARNPNSVINLKSIILPPDSLTKQTRTVVSQPTVESIFRIEPAVVTDATEVVQGETHVFLTPQDLAVAQQTFAAIGKLSRDAEQVPDLSYLETPEIQKRLIAEVEATYNAGQLEMEGVAPAVDIPAVIAKATAAIIQRTISIPRIVVVPSGEVRSWFEPFTLDLTALRFPPVSDTLWQQSLATQQRRVIGVGTESALEPRLEDYVVSGLIDFDDVSYDANAELLYDLASQVLTHLGSYLSDEEIPRVLRVHQREIAQFVHSQMLAHYREDAVAYEAKISQGVSDIRPHSFTQTEPPRDFRLSPPDKSNMMRYLFAGFERSLHPVLKFGSEAERILAVILDRDAIKWLKPAAGQFRLNYRVGGEWGEYQPDFVAEVADRIVMLEPKARNQMDAADVIAKRDAAITWCRHATDHATAHGGKPWSYALIPHDAITENWSLPQLVERWAVS